MHTKKSIPLLISLFLVFVAANEYEQNEFISGSEAGGLAVQEVVEPFTKNDSIARKLITSGRQLAFVSYAADCYTCAND